MSDIGSSLGSLFGGGVGGTAPAAPTSTGIGAALGGLFGGTGAAAAGGQSPVQVAQSHLSNELGKVIATGNKSAIGQANAVANSKGHNNILTNIFHAIDTPRAAVLATGRQLEHAVTGHGFNTQQLESDISNHTGVGDLLKQNGVGGWLGRGLGFVGDIATDPLTYLTLGAGSAAEMGAKGIAEQIAKGAAEDGAGALTKETLARFVAKGTAGLTDAEHAALAERGVQAGGAYMRVPLTKLAQHFGVGEAKYVPLLGSGVTDTLTGPARQLYNILADTKIGSAIGDTLSKTGGIRNAMRTAAMGNDTEGVWNAFHTLQAAPLLKSSANAFVAEHVPGLAESLGKFNPELHADDLRNALEHAPDTAEHATALAGLAKNGIANPGDSVAAVRQWLNTVKDAAGSHGVDLSHFEDYFPHQLTQAARDAGQATRSGAAGKIAAEFARTLRPGEKFMGQTLEHGTVDEINQIGKAQLGDAWHEMFNGNPHQVLPRYLQQIGRRVGQADFLQALKDSGTVSDRWAPEELVGKAAGLTDHLSAQQMYEAAQQRGNNLYSKLQDLGGPAATDEHEQAFNDLTSHAANTEERLKAQGAAPNDMALKQTLTDSPKAKAVFADMLKPGNAEISGTLASLSDKAQQAPAWLGDAMDRLTSIPKKGGLNNFLSKYYDPQLRLWKAYSLMTPGKAVRHQFGAMFNMWLANVSLHNMADSFSMLHDYHGQGLDALPEDAKATVKAALDNHVFHSSQFTEDEQEILGHGGKGNLNPLSANNKLLKANSNIQNKAQDYIRFAVFHDAMAKGMTAGEAADKVRTFLFDWGDHTNFEQNVLKRLIPFYTFTRQNVPLMLHQMALQPGKFETFYHLAHNIELGTPPDSVVPQFFKDTLGVHLPWKSGGNSTYWRPDLPFARMGETLNGLGQLAHGHPNWLMSQTTPVLKTPIEEWAGKSFYTNAKFAGTDPTKGPHVQGAPGAWTKIPGLMEALQLLGHAHTVSAPMVGTNKAQINAGQWAMTPAAIYGLESLVPGLGQLRRMVPTEPNQQTRGGTNKLAYLLGQNFSTNDPTQQAGDVWNKYDTVQKIYNALQDKGLAPQTTTRRRR